MAWYVDRVDVWGGEGAGLLVHDGGNTVYVPLPEIGDFLARLGRELEQLDSTGDIEYVRMLNDAYERGRR